MSFAKDLKYFTNVLQLGFKTRPSARSAAAQMRRFGNDKFNHGVGVGMRRAHMYLPGADAGVLRGDWTKTVRSATTVIRQDFTALCARAELAYRSDPLARRAVNIIAAYLVGQGNKPHPAVKLANGDPVEGINGQLSADWERFNDQGIRTGNTRMTVYQAQLLSLITMIVYGSTLKTVVKSKPGSLLPFAFQILKPTRLDFSKDSYIKRAGDTVANNTIHGMQLDNYGEATAFHFLEEEKARSASNVLLSYYPIEAEQYLGISWLAPVLPVMFDRQQLIGDKLTTSRIGAKLGIKFPKEMQEGVEKLLSDGGSGSDGSNYDYLDLDYQGGVFSDKDIKPISITDPISDTFAELLRMIMLEIGVGLGFSYQMLTSDLKDANFTSGRMNHIVDTKMFKMLYKSITKIDHQPMWDKFVEWEVISGRLSRYGVGPSQYYADPAYYNECYWLPKDGNEWLEPLKEAQSAILERKAGTTSMESDLASRGIGLKAHLRQLKKERDLIKEYDLECFLPENISATAKVTDTSDALEEPTNASAKNDQSV